MADRFTALKKKGILFLLIFLGAIIPFSSDLYLPVLSGMAISFNASVSEMNITLLLFMGFLHKLSSFFFHERNDSSNRS